MSIIDRVRKYNQDLANALKKHAGIRKTVEDLYPDNAHFIYELFQNAEDTGATHVELRLERDRLIFEHNGDAFSENDVKAITDIGAGNKSEEGEKIGRFGIGFKSVFTYSDTPHVWSPSFSFKIEDMVLPYELSNRPSLGKSTLFEFPFNSPKKSRSDAFSEIKRGLEELNETTLLFLSRITEIIWSIEKGQKGRLRRIERAQHRIEIRRTVDSKQVKGAMFLRFQEPVHGLEHQNVAVAFELLPRLKKQGQMVEPIAQRFKIVPAEKGRVAVFFPAAKETSNLHFHLHAPFVPELSRASIKETQENEVLYQQLADLSVSALNSIRDLGLLDRQFLEVLPNSGDFIPGRYNPIRDAIVDSMNRQHLTPKHNGGHSPAENMLQADAAFKQLITQSDMRFLTQRHGKSLEWAINITKNNMRIDRFLNDLKIEDFGIAKFIEALKDNLSVREEYSLYGWRRRTPNKDFEAWLSNKSMEWHRKLYGLLRQKTHGQLYSPFADIIIVRCSNGDYKTASECFFSTSFDSHNSIHNYVDPQICTSTSSSNEEQQALAFLKEIGVREIDEMQLVEDILHKYYSGDVNHKIDWETHVSHTARFVAILAKDEDILKALKQHYIIFGADGHWHKPGKIFVDSPFVDTGLTAYYQLASSFGRRTALNEDYTSVDSQKTFLDFLLKLGVANVLEVIMVKCTNNPDFNDLLRATGQPRDSGTDRDYVIPGLEDLFKFPSHQTSCLLLKTLTEVCTLNSSSIDHYLEATYRQNQSNPARHAKSQLLLQLRTIRWIPQVGGSFVTPSEADSKKLPAWFSLRGHQKLVDALEFGESTNKPNEMLDRSILAKFGFANQEAFCDAKEFLQYPAADRKKMLDQMQQRRELPRNVPSNPRQRTKNVRRKARSAPLKKYEKREVSVEVNRQPIKKERTEIYLLDQYTKPDGQTICQACQDTLPFKLPNGKYYHEDIEFIPDLMRIHYQNFLILCPNHAAMYKHANSSRIILRNLFQKIDNNELDIELGGRPTKLYFTETHIADLRAVLETEDE